LKFPNQTASISHGGNVENRKIGSCVEGKERMMVDDDDEKEEEEEERRMTDWYFL
jgi:hypothetical protein